jgi:hypothetical protein
MKAEIARTICLKNYEIVYCPWIIYKISWNNKIYHKLLNIWLKLHGYEEWTDNSEEQKVQSQ